MPEISSFVNAADCRFVTFQYAHLTRTSAMKPAVCSLFFSLCLILSAGCCGPMWNPGCGTGCGPSCSDGCGACEGCGELYVDPWINDPADCCDPCDSCGNYNGQSCGKCRPVFAGVKSLWGYRCADNCGGCDGGCDSCGDGGCDSCGGGGDCGCGGSTTSYTAGHPGRMAPGYANVEDSGYELRDGETLVESSITPGSRATSSAAMTSQPRVTRKPGPAKQIFQPRRVNQSRPLAY